MTFERLWATRLIWDRSRLLLLSDLGRLIGCRDLDEFWDVDASVHCIEAYHRKTKWTGNRFDWKQSMNTS